MDLVELIEAVGQKPWIELMGGAPQAPAVQPPVPTGEPRPQQVNPEQPNIPVQEPKKKDIHRHKVAEFYIRFKPQFGGGYYKVRIKRTEKYGMLYNYGYFDRPSIPQVHFNPTHLTKPGAEDYRKLKAYMQSHEHSKAKQTRSSQNDDSNSIL